MPVYGIAEAKAKFSELIERAERGEEVVIARHGKPVVQWSRPAAPKPERRMTLDELRRLRESEPLQGTSTAEIVRQQRDEGY
jgi:antitoxin (DNA-binding transcriptional repressor) of toxin-antitoxin stability system